MRPLARVALAAALTPTTLLALVFCDRLWVTAIRPELLNLRARKAGMRIDGAVARSVTVTPREFDAMTEDRPGVVLPELADAITKARAAHEQDMADMAGEERAS